MDRTAIYNFKQTASKSSDTGGEVGNSEPPVDVQSLGIGAR